jgi:hypothetical protein
VLSNSSLAYIERAILATNSNEEEDVEEINILTSIE